MLFFLVWRLSASCCHRRIEASKLMPMPMNHLALCLKHATAA